jgi:hypothetical protein
MHAHTYINTDEMKMRAKMDNITLYTITFNIHVACVSLWSVTIIKIKIYQKMPFAHTGRYGKTVILSFVSENN